jgi:hypothetical protein
MSDETPTPNATSTTAAAPNEVTTQSTVKPGRLTSEFYLKLAAVLLSALMASGLITDDRWLRLAGVVGAVLSAYGYTVSRTAIKTAAMPVLLVGLLWHTSGCAWFKSETRAVAGDVVDCTKAEAVKAITQFGPALDALLVYATGGNGQLNADAVKDASKGFAKEIGTCVLADSITRALKPAAADPSAPKSSPLEADPESLRQAFEAVRRSVAPGASFKTAQGVI